MVIEKVRPVDFRVPLRVRILRSEVRKLEDDFRHVQSFACLHPLRRTCPRLVLTDRSLSTFGRYQTFVPCALVGRSAEWNNNKRKTTHNDLSTLCETFFLPSKYNALPVPLN